MLTKRTSTAANKSYFGIDTYPNFLKDVYFVQN